MQADSPTGDPPPEVSPLDYHYLRLVAEWASGLRDRELFFEYRRRDLRVRGNVGQQDRAVVLPAHTADPAPKPPLDGLRLEIPGAGSVSPLEFGAEAVFWSEAAVEKFLVPYYASLAAGSADLFLADLLGAWNRAPDGVDVVALVHRFHPAADGPLTLHGMVGVVYRAGGESGILPLDVFLERHPPVERPVPQPCGPVPPPGAVPVLKAIAAGARLPGYTDLRGIAEWASSLRGSPVCFAFDTRTGEYGPMDRRHASAAQVLVPTCTPAMVPSRTAPSAVWIHPPTGSPRDLAQYPVSDAVVWTTAAVERFLLPYYTSCRAWNAASELQRITAVWQRGSPPGAGSRAGEVYALTHLPKSDWVGLQEAAAFGELGVVHRDPVSGETVVRPFSEAEGLVPPPGA